MIEFVVLLVFVLLIVFIVAFFHFVIEAVVSEYTEEDSKESSNVTLNVYNVIGECIFSSKFDTKEEAINFIENNRLSLQGMRFTIE